MRYEFETEEVDVTKNVTNDVTKTTDGTQSESDGTQSESNGTQNDTQSEINGTQNDIQSELNDTQSETNDTQNVPNDVLNDTQSEVNDTQSEVNDTQNDTQKVVRRRKQIERLIAEDAHISTSVIAGKVGSSAITIKRDLKEMGYTWVGHPKTGKWVVQTKETVK